MAARILVVDDEPAFLDSMRRGLLLSGFTRVRLERGPLAADYLLPNRSSRIILHRYTGLAAGSLQAMREDQVNEAFVNKDQVDLGLCGRGGHYFIRGLNRLAGIMASKRCPERN
jgi:hypothetical protein